MPTRALTPPGGYVAKVGTKFTLWPTSICEDAMSLLKENGRMKHNHFYALRSSAK